MSDMFTTIADYKQSKLNESIDNRAKAMVYTLFDTDPNDTFEEQDRISAIIEKIEDFLHSMSFENFEMLLQKMNMSPAYSAQDLWDFNISEWQRDAQEALVGWLFTHNYLSLNGWIGESITNESTINEQVTSITKGLDQSKEYKWGFNSPFAAKYKLAYEYDDEADDKLWRLSIGNSGGRWWPFAAEYGDGYGTKAFTWSFRHSPSNKIPNDLEQELYKNNYTRDSNLPFLELDKDYPSMYVILRTIGLSAPTEMTTERVITTENLSSESGISDKVFTPDYPKKTRREIAEIFVDTYSVTKDYKGEGRTQAIEKMLNVLTDENCQNFINMLAQFGDDMHHVTSTIIEDVDLDSVEW
jgi:hypothetical protein